MIMDILFLLIFVHIPVLYIVLSIFLRVSFLKIDIINFLIVSIFILSYLGVFPLYFQLDEYRVELGVTNKFLLIQVLLLSFVSSVFLIAGYLLASLYFFKNSSSDLDILNTKSGTYNGISIIKPMFILFFIIVLLLYYLHIVPSIALIELLKGASTTEINLSRSHMTNAFSGYGYFRLVLHNMSIFLSIYSFLLFLVNKKITTLFIFIVSFIVTSFSLLITTEKAPFAWFMISIFMAYCFISYNQRFPIGKTLIFSMVIVIVLAVSYIVFMDVSNLFSGIWSVFSRAFSGSIQPAYHYLELFPDKIDFLLGKSFPNPRNIFPFEHFYLTQEVMKIVNPQDYENGIIGTMPTVFWGELYVNFSYIGVLFFSFILGAYICLIRSIVNKIACPVTQLTLLIMLTMHFKDLSVTSFSNYLIDVNLIFLFIVAIFLSKRKVISN